MSKVDKTRLGVFGARIGSQTKETSIVLERVNWEFKSLHTLTIITVLTNATQLSIKANTISEISLRV